MMPGVTEDDLRPLELTNSGQDLLHEDGLSGTGSHCLRGSIDGSSNEVGFVREHSGFR